MTWLLAGAVWQLATHLQGVATTVLAVDVVAGGVAWTFPARRRPGGAP